ncbi:protein KRI1 homolog isoform X1 [Ctenocephalides felis]|uniref:protein KRI1 homolog isoform X1 n=1 Tax=Ctenocephalides felis TaxID=7515 RepID=UPI000E6E5600|nr:protein KRI1 homolog isoform X1 [Ctenocephalides felis]
MSKLFDGDDSDSDVNIKTDNPYAKNYDIWRQKEELNKLKTVYGEEALNDYDDSSSSSSEDEDAKELTEEVEKDFFRTLACLKNKDPKIYDKDVNFFSENKEQNTKKKKTKPEKPITLRDHERKLLLEGDIEDLGNASERPQSPTFVEEQKQIRDSLLKIVHDDESENEKDSEDFGGIFHKREKTKEDKEKEEEEYRQWLAGKKKELENKNEESELKPLKDYWNNPTLDENESFLRDYLLNKRFLDDEDDSYIPSYEEIVHDSDENLSEDEKNIEAQEEFEHKYNFRFEEPDQEFLKRYPRTMEHSVRRKDDKRKKKRAELKERKAQEKARKCEELKQLKSLKRKEIEEKIQQLREITGNEQICFQDEDIEGDFDPEAHDARMQEIFNNDFYAVEESDQKPVFPEDDDFMEDDWDNWKGEQDDYDNAPHCEDDDFNMDCDYDPTTKTTKNNDTQNMLIENSCSKRNRRRKSKFAEVLAQKKPVFDPNDKTYEEYLDEYYKLDYEDMIGDLPCRFKYKKVMPNSFGLTIDEILAAKDKELNSWCSLKKAVQIRPDHVEKYDQIAYERKSRNLALKKKALKSLYQEPEEEDPEIKSLTVDISENDKRKTEEVEEWKMTVT